ncbi:hypothetical protein WICMUC_002388 [Wickerhamomyces mucosus]|uniref:Uncharacterized protein n=1 Tax=Wickerhamomyces mucosus TaxID=1378264 RepID=A0A9P8PQ04_9ASCO|nr:hypothetical protein WICMUC_002388 [Wickerhamomyces mucosus]
MMLVNSLLSRFLILLFFCLSFVQCALPIDNVKLFRNSDSIIEIDSSNLNQILVGERSYYISLFFTSDDPALNCKICAQFEPIYKKVIKSLFKIENLQNKIVFAKVDFEKNKPFFKELGLTHIPKLWILPPTEDSNSNASNQPHYEYTISEQSLDPLNLGDYIAKLLHITVKIDTDFEVSEFLGYFLFTFSIVLIFKKLVIQKYPKYKLFQLISVALILLFISGYMFTVIRGIPLISKDAKGEIMYFSGGTHWQFGLETFLIASIYSALISGIVVLVQILPKLENEIKKNVLIICVNIGMIYLLSYFISIYLIKDGSYPFRLLEL